MLQTAYNDWSLVSLSPLPVWLKLGLTLALAVAATVVLFSYRHARRPWLLIGLRAIATLVVLGIITEPALQLKVVRRVKSRLALVLDRSASMALPLGPTQSRYERALAVIQQSQATLETLQEEHTLAWYDLNGPLAETNINTPPTDPATDLVSALEHAKAAPGGRPLAGIVLLSDGADNAGLEGAPRGSLAKPALDRLHRLGVPVNTLSVSQSDEFRDIAVTDVVADEFAFVHNTLEISARIEATGFDGLTVPVTLKREGAVLATTELAVRHEAQEVRFSIKPDQIGEFVHTVELPAIAGDALPENNHRTFVLRVIRDKIRVLHVVGRPSWDERFLRQHLKENPNVDLVSFFILRTLSDDQSVPESDLALIPFPVKELFTTELQKFDVVVFQNFDFRPYNMEQYLGNIRDAVKAGLGFVMIGGNQSFGQGGYLGTPIDEILPLKLDGGDLLNARVEASVTPAGLAHPITDLSHGGGNSQRLWAELPAWPSLNRTAGLKPHAAALVVDSAHAGLDSTAAPLIAVMDAGQGRTLAIATDSMWRWRFATARQGGAAERAYHRFWSNALHWLVRDPEHARIRVLPDKRRFELGEVAEGSVVVRGRDYQTLAHAPVRLLLLDNAGNQQHLDDLTTDDNGVARFRYAGLSAGAYHLQARLGQTAEDSGAGQAVFMLESRAEEQTRATPRSDLLSAIANATQGNVLSADAHPFAHLKRLAPDVVEVDRRRNIELWDNGWALLLALLCLATDWAVRRNRGYL